MPTPSPPPASKPHPHPPSPRAAASSATARFAFPRGLGGVPPSPCKIFSNHWKNWPKFSNHWKIIFQSLENFSAPHEPPDCAKPAVCNRLCLSQPPAANTERAEEGDTEVAGRELRARSNLFFRSLAFVEEFGARGCPSHTTPKKNLRASFLRPLRVCAAGHPPVPPPPANPLQRKLAPPARTPYTARANEEHAVSPIPSPDTRPAQVSTPSTVKPAAPFRPAAALLSLVTRHSSLP